MIPRLSLTVAVALLAAAWLGPLPAMSAQSFAAHMLLHILVVAVVPPLAVIGLAGSRRDPIERAPWLFAPVPASLVDLMVVWAWHTPQLHHAARMRPEMFVAEQASFLAVGMWLWWSVLGGARDRREARASGGVLALLMTFAHMTLLGALLTLAPRVLYTHGDPAFASPLADQQLGGTIMLVGAGLSYITGGLWLSRTLLRQPRAQAVHP